MKKDSLGNIGLVVITYRFPIDLSCLFSVVFNCKISDYLIRRRIIKRYKISLHPITCDLSIY